MSDLYTVAFSVWNAPQDARFEFEELAVSFAQLLEDVDDVENVKVFDEFHEMGCTEIYPNDEREK